jgi:hypothetical protein
MFNIQPGQGVGYSASKEIALGLGTGFVVSEALTIITDLIFRRTSITNTFRRVEVEKIFRREDVCS